MISEQQDLEVFVYGRAAPYADEGKPPSTGAVGLLFGCTTQNDCTAKKHKLVVFRPLNVLRSIYSVTARSK